MTEDDVKVFYIFKDLVGNLERICDDKGVDFKCYKNQDDKKAYFRFQVRNKVLKHEVSFTELLYKDSEFITHEINNRLLTLFDIVKNERR